MIELPLPGTTAVEQWVAIVDDHPSVRTALARMLRLEGIRVGAYGSAEEYLGAGVSDRLPTCIVLDVQLGPGTMNGLDLRQFIVNNQPSVHVIMMSAHDAEEALDQGGGMEVVEFLRKPFEREVFVSLVKSALTAPAPVVAEP